MFDALFRREPQYDENGRVIGYSQPKIVWIILALIVFLLLQGSIHETEWWKKKKIFFKRAFF